MQTALALPAVSPASNPVIEVAQSIAAMLRGGETIDAGMLRALFKSAAGLSQANAGWLMRDAYDALELAQVLVLNDPEFAVEASDPARCSPASPP